MEIMLCENKHSIISTRVANKNYLRFFACNIIKSNDWPWISRDKISYNNGYMLKRILSDTLYILAKQPSRNARVAFKRLLNIPIDVRNSSGKYTENLSSQTLWRCIDKMLRLNIQFFIYRTPPFGMLFTHVWKHKHIEKIKNWEIKSFLSSTETFDNSFKHGLQWK